MRPYFTFISVLLIIFVHAQNNMEILWQECYGGSDNDYSTCLINSENGYLIFGEIRSNDGNISNNHGDRDIWIVSIDTTGNILWERAYGGSGPDYPNNIIQSNNDYYFGAGVWSNDGDIQSGNHGEYDRWIVKINGDGRNVTVDTATKECTGEFNVKVKIIGLLQAVQIITPMM